MYTKICQNVGHISYIFFIHFVYISSDLQKVYIIKIMYTIYIQNSYRMYIQIIVFKMDPSFQHIVTCFLCTSKLIIAHNLDLKLASYVEVTIK